MSEALLCLTEALPFYAQDVCKEKSFKHDSSADSDSIDKNLKTDNYVSNSIPQDENQYANCSQNSDQMVLKRSLSRKREASNILMESVKRRENMQNMDLSFNVPCEPNSHNFVPISLEQVSVIPEASFNKELRTSDEQSVGDSPTDINSTLSSLTDSGIDSSKSSSPSPSIDNISCLDGESSPSFMEIDEPKELSAPAIESERDSSEGDLSPKSTAISEDLDCLNLEESSKSPSENIAIPKASVIQGLFKNSPHVLYFSTKEEIVEPLSSETLQLMKWKLSTITPVIIKDMVLKCGFHLVEADTTEDWLGTWGKHLKCTTFRKIKKFQKVNHYPGGFHLGRKDKLWNNIRKMQNKHGREQFSFFPDTYVLPGDIKLLKKIWETETDHCWIRKPCASARGTGVKVIHKWSQVPKNRPAVVQRYISDPYLINGSKFDLRVYVLVPSFNPLRIYIFQDGLVRFASEKYSLSNKSFANRFIHLTNYSINKRSSAYTSNEDENLCQGHKWSLKSFWVYMSNSGIDVDKIKATIVDMVIKTVISSEGPISRLMKTYARCSYNCFELFGFDIMLDKDLRPWLLEVNISPSLHTKSTLDLNVKAPVVKDMLNIAGFEIPEKCTVASLDSVYLSSDGNRHQPILRMLSPEEKKKHSSFTSRNLRGKNNILENLTLDDLYCLMESEEEYNRRGSFVRIFPTETSYKYFLYFDRISYYNVLLDAWEQAFHNDRMKGISYIQELFEKMPDQKNSTKTTVQETEDLKITAH